MFFFEEITLLITHYNRSNSLERLLRTIANLELQFGEIIVSDDCSREDQLLILKELQAKYNFRLITTLVNRGLANNINKGQDAVKTPYTLYIQEDFLPFPAFVDKLKVAYQFMKDDAELDFVRFYAYFNHPYLKPVGKGFSQMLFKHSYFWQGYYKFYIYSDHPHLRRSNFLEKFGKYDEGIKSDRAEYNQMMKVLAVGAKVYFYDDFKALFDQVNSAEEPSTVKRNFWRNNSSVFISLTRHLYRYLRFNIELLIFKLRK